MTEEKKEGATQREIPIPKTGTEVMTDVSLDAHMMIYLASEGILVPFLPPVIHKSYMNLLLCCDYDTAVSKLTDWRYRKSDVEAFKLNHKDLLEQSRKEGTNANAPSVHTETILSQSETNDGDNRQEGKFETDRKPNVTDYIEQRRKEGLRKEEIAVELYDKSGHFRLTNLELARALRLDAGLNESQTAALKQRGQRARIAGKVLLQKK